MKRGPAESDNIENKEKTTKKRNLNHDASELQNWPFHMACNAGDTELVKNFILSGADLNAVDALGMTPLDYAIGSDQPCIASLLICCGAKIKKSRKKRNLNMDALELQNWPLHMACNAGDTELVKNFISSGADLNAVDALGMTPLDYAIGSDQPDIASLLICCGAKYDRLNDYIDNLFRNILNLVRYGDKNPRASSGRRGIQVPISAPKKEDFFLHAVKFDNELMVRTLLNEGVNINYVPEFKESALMYAVENKNINMIKLLLEQGCDVNYLLYSREEYRFPALAKVVEYCVEDDWDIYAENIQYLPDIVKLLITAGADESIEVSTYFGEGTVSDLLKIRLKNIDDFILGGYVIEKFRETITFIKENIEKTIEILRISSKLRLVVNTVVLLASLPPSNLNMIDLVSWADNNIESMKLKIKLEEIQYLSKLLLNRFNSIMPILQNDENRKDFVAELATKVRSQKNITASMIDGIIFRHTPACVLAQGLGKHSRYIPLNVMRKIVKTTFPESSQSRTDWGYRREKNKRKIT